MINPEKILSFYAAGTAQIKGEGSAFPIIELRCNRDYIKERTLQAGAKPARKQIALSYFLNYNKQ